MNDPATNESVDEGWRTVTVNAVPRGKKRTPIATTALVLILLVVGVGVIYGLTLKQPFTPDAFGARVAAEHFVRDRLKSPKTAEFAPFKDSTVRLTDDGRYLVTSYVDSENTYSAMLRSHFVVELGTDETGWRLLSVNFVEPYGATRAAADSPPATYSARSAR